MEPDLLEATRRGPAGRLFVALWGGLAVVDVSRPAGALLSGGLVLVLVAACGVHQTWWSAASIATTGWLVVNGFVQHRYGELGFGASSWALFALALAVVLAVAARTGSTRSLPR
ncbi:hypothetical protein [Nocardioides pocheonensis]|uniref:Uncharacterized protein n=1 Tax=Nocardioides pocheonensis TaxID=661485 RepID=A0A3N0GUX5_9ACTN|nr:hypothetical protein [Nocardioides pocheonensis]RNM16257.1 hypothetical protein EFL26_05720 [Nocardioides pocheonensis]